jgi:hypothetical protein
MHPFPIKYECVDCNKSISTYQAEATGGFCNSCEPQPVYEDEACPECKVPYHLEHISQESYKDYRKASVAYFYLTNHWLVKLAAKFKIIKL